MRSVSRSAVLALSCAVLVIALSTNCGNSNFFPSQTAIIGLSISPASGVVPPGSTANFSATGTLGNNSTQDVTSTVTWTSSSPGIATVSAGAAKGVALGVTTITATSNNVSASATLLVSNITSIKISPSSWSPLSSGQTQQFAAQGSDGSDVTAYVAWTTSDSNCATVTSTGFATYVGSTTGCTITATIGSYSSSVTLGTIL
jgi:hypothetical protein